MTFNGIDRPEAWRDMLRGRRVGLLTSAAGFDRSLRRSVDCLAAEGLRLTALFAPEHGIRGAQAAGAEVAAACDPPTGLPVYSLYRKDSKRFTENMLREVDVVVYDIADVGARFYTYATTLLYTVEDCARFGKPLVVLDRANPLGGDILEGGALLPDCHSFIGDYPMPIRYGLTPGEFARMVNAERNIGCDLTVIPLEGWRRAMLYPETGLPWVPPSPALQHFENALLYPGLCLLEGTNLSEGRGTADPFALVGAPYVDGDRLAQAMQAEQLPGVRFLPIAFTPCASKYEGVPCEGVKVILTEPHACRAVTVGLALLSAVRALWPDDFRFQTPGADFDRPQIDLLSGSRRLREGQPTDGYLADARAACEAFDRRRKPYLLYGGD